MSENKTLVIIDGNSLLFRAYYAMQRPMITSEGQYTHAVYGFINMLTKIKKDYTPGYIAVAFDLAAPTFRHLEYSEYKANRKKMPPELAMQIEPLREVLTAMNIKILDLAGYEGDDIIGTVARRGEAEGLSPLIITGDRDALQLATDVTKVLITKKGISEFELFDAAHMQEVYNMTPLQFIDYKGLRGDTSDNIPGIPGVGEKTALKYISEFGSLENLLANADSIDSARMREKIKENAELAVMSKRLATINCNVPIEFDIADLICKEPDFDRLINIYVKLEFNSLLKKLKVTDRAFTKVEDTDLRKKDIAAETEYKLTYEICSENAFEKLQIAIDNNYPVVITSYSDDNHLERPRIQGFAFAPILESPGESKVYFVTENDMALIEALVLRISEHGIPVIGHNLKADYYAFLSNFDFKRNDIAFNTLFDTSIAEYILNPSAKDYFLNNIYLEYFHKNIRSMADFDDSMAQIDMFTDVSKTYADFAAEYISAILSVYYAQQKRLNKEELNSVAREIEFPLVEVMASMESEGFRLDDKELAAIGIPIREKIDELTGEIFKMAGGEFNINSPKQLGDILFEKLGIPAGKKTKTGYSTGAEVLEKLKDDYPIVEKILEYRQLSKLNSTYIEGLIPLKAKDERIHAHFQQTVTATGRISCTEPNLQNIPVRHEIGRNIRRAFIPRDTDHVLIGADYSQIELRVLAHLSGEQSLIDAFNSGADIHKMTASKVFNVPFEEVTAIQRSNAKAVNFGVIYGMSGFGLASELNISRKSAELYIKDYFLKYQNVKAYMEKQVEFCKEHGYVKTVSGRKRKINEINASNYMVRQLGERLAMNTPIQGSAADIIKLAMIKTYKALKNNNYRSKLILQVHDELIIDAASDEAEAVKELLTKSMESVMAMSVKLTAEPECGNNWYELK